MALSKILEIVWAQVYKNVYGHHHMLKKEYSGKLGAEQTYFLSSLHYTRT